MIDLLIANPLLLLSLVAGLGYPLGQLRIAGVNVGIGAVLFVGLAVGALHPDLELPEIVYLLGLVLFVYIVGLGSGASFFESLRGRGVRDNLVVAVLLAAAAGLTLLLGAAAGLSPGARAGLFAGSLTNTPALAAAMDVLRQSSAGDAAVRLDEPTVAYSLAYPFGILGVILAIHAVRRAFGIARPPRTTSEALDVAIVRVTSSPAAGRTVREVLADHRWRAVLGRVKRGEHVMVATDTLQLTHGDLVSVVASRGEMDDIVAFLGERHPERIDLDRSEVDYRRIIVSDRRVAGRTLRDIDLPGVFGAIVTRVSRGDVDFLPSGGTLVQLGDRLRVLTYRGNLGEVSRFFGDSYRALGEIDVLAFSLGLFAGLLAGLVPVPLPGGGVFRLGLAGGPLLVALVLGKVGRTGPIVWTLPFNASLTLRQLGLVLFLAGIGTRAGYEFGIALLSGEGVALLAAGAAVTAVTASALLLVGHLVFRVPFDTLSGLVAGLHTQPAVLAFAVEQADSEAPNVGYATVYPTATVLKVILAQTLASLPG